MFAIAIIVKVRLYENRKMVQPGSYGSESVKSCF